MRHPWRTRAVLLALVNGLAGVAVALGVSADALHPIVAAVVALAALLADLGILRDGESETTPLEDPRGRDGSPLVPLTVKPTVGLTDERILALFEEPNGADLHERGIL